MVVCEHVCEHEGLHIVCAHACDFLPTVFHVWLRCLYLELSRGCRAVHRACILEFSGHVSQYDLEGNILKSFDG